MVDQKKDIIIANPMYDVVFKTLMQADFARYFVGSIISEEIIDIDFDSQEYTTMLIKNRLKDTHMTLIPKPIKFYIKWQKH